MGAGAGRAAPRRGLDVADGFARGAGELRAGDLVRAGQLARAAAHVAHHRPAERAHPGRAAGCRGPRPAHAAASRASRPRSGRPRRVRALPAGVQLGPPDDAQRLQQQHAALPDGGPRGHPQRDGAQRPDHPPRRARASAGRAAAVGRRLARELGGRHPRRRDHQLPARDRVRRLERQPAPRRADHARRRGHAALRVHGARSDDVGRAVDRARRHDADGRAAVRVRLPRGELLDGELALGRARPGGGGRRTPTSREFVLAVAEHGSRVWRRAWYGRPRRADG